MMSHREPIQACINGEKTDHTPIALWCHFCVDDQDPETLAASTLHLQNNGNLVAARKSVEVKL